MSIAGLSSEEQSSLKATRASTAHGYRNVSLTRVPKPTAGFCRFQDCLANGMQTRYVLTKRKKRAEKMKIQRIGQRTSEGMKRSFSMAFRFTEEEEMELQLQACKVKQSLLTSLFQQFSKDRSKHITFLQDMCIKRVLSKDILDKVDEMSIMNFLFHTPEMSLLTPYDRISLFKYNCKKLRGSHG